MTDAEALFFVNHDEAEFRQFYIGRENSVRANKDIDLAFSGCFSDGLLFFCRAKTS